MSSAADNPAPITRHRPRFGLIGAITLLLMAFACLATIPWTFGISSPSPRQDDASRAPRYDLHDTDAALLPPLWAPHAEDERDRIDAYSDQHGQVPRPILGTDRLGRDLLVRCLAGGAISMSIGISAAFIAVIIGVGYGSIAGFVGGRVDAFMMRIVDVLYGLPYVLIVVLIAVAVDGFVERAGTDLPTTARQFISVLTLLAAIGSVSWLTMARVIRGQVLSLRAQPFMEAARAIGVPARRQFTRHLLPNLIGPIVVYATLTVPAAILSESFLSFLGIGVREPLPSWGNLAAQGLSELNPVRMRWWLLVFPCLLIALTLLSLNFVGESLRERLDPK